MWCSKCHAGSINTKFSGLGKARCSQCGTVATFDDKGNETPFYTHNDPFQEIREKRLKKNQANSSGAKPTSKPRKAAEDGPTQAESDFAFVSSKKNASKICPDNNL
jgi:hypothetical protein